MCVFFKWSIFRVTALSCFSLLFFHVSHILIFSLKNCFLFFLFLVFLSNAFHCWHQYQSLTKYGSSVVGAPWRCGVLTTLGGIAGIGLDHLLRERA